MGRPFIVNVAPLLRTPGSRQHEHREGVLRDLKVTGSGVPEGSDVAVDVVLESVDGGTLVAKGTVQAPWRGECRRCLTEVTDQIEVQVREIFRRDDARAGDDDGETYPMVGDQVDLEPLAREAVVLELPQVPLCQQECKGLCPECGADRNESDCGHRPAVGNPAWAVLDALRTEP